MADQTKAVNMADEASPEQETGGGCGCLTFLVIIAIIVGIGFGIAECHKTTWEKCLDQAAQVVPADDWEGYSDGAYRLYLETVCEISLRSGWRPD